MALNNNKALVGVLCVLIVISTMPVLHVAISCGNVQMALVPCMGYLTGQPGPSSACCTGAKNLESMTPTPADKITACQCMKTAATSIPGLNYANAAAISAKCGVNVPFKITPNSIDCSM